MRGKNDPEFERRFRMKIVSARAKRALTLAAIVAAATFYCARIRAAAARDHIGAHESVADGRAADSLLRARCVTTASSWAQGSIWTVTQFEVLENSRARRNRAFKCDCRADAWGTFRMNVEAAPRFQPGEEGVLFLEKTREREITR